MNRLWSQLHLASGLAIVLLSLACNTTEQQPPPDSTAIATLYKRAMELVSRSQLDSAHAVFAAIVRKDSSQYTALLGLAEINLRKRKVDAAVPLLQRAMRADPQRVEAAFQLAQVYRMQRRDDAARDLLEQIVARFPTYTPACMAYADLLMTDAPPSPQGALDQYEAILAIDPDLQRARAGAAASRLRLGQFERAAIELSELLTAKPNDPHLNFLLAVALHWQQDYPQAIRAYKRAIDVLPIASPLRPMRQWNLRLAYLAQHGQYPGDLAPEYAISLAIEPPPSPVHFTDIAATAGVAKVDRGRGVAWADFDSDGWLDLFTVGIQTTHGLYMRRDEQFELANERAGLNDDSKGGWSAVAADYDGDGDIDIYVTRDAWEGAAANSLYDNDSRARFVDRAIDAGVDDPADSFTAAWGDVDSDGWLDLYVADGITGSGAANKLFLNQGDRSFAESARARAVDDSGKSLGVAFGDYDNDGDLDLYVANVAGPNRLYRNDGARFAEIASSAGVSRPHSGSYVPFFFDSDNDGDLDLFVSAMAYYEDYIESATSTALSHRSRAHLYRNDGGDHFREIATEMGLARAFGSMGAGFGDVDSDGTLDIYLANGGPVMARFEPNALYLRQGERYVDVADSAGVGNLGKGHGVAFADYDADGDLDLYVGHGGHYPGDLWPNSLYRNEGTTAHWLTVLLQGRAPNINAIGAHVQLHSGDHVQRAQVHSGGGFGSTDSYALEFGLNNSTNVDSIIIRWPSGRSERHGPFEVDRFIRFTEPK
jgi:tetratricopeptide (TPR) repeat protein